MEHDVTSEFPTTFINRFTNFLLGRTEKLPITERNFNGHSYRLQHYRLPQFKLAYRRRGWDIPRCCNTRGLGPADTDHPRDHLADLLDPGCSNWNGRSPRAHDVPIKQEGKDNGVHNRQRKLHRLPQSHSDDCGDCGDLPRRSHACSCRLTHPHNFGNYQSYICHTRSSNWNGRGNGALAIPVKKSEQAPGLRARFPSLIALALVFFVAVLPIAVSATTISFSPLGLEEETLLIHNSTGSLIGVYNTSTKDIAFADNGSYSILVEPSNSNLLANHPDAWLENLLSHIQSHAWTYILIVFGAAMLIYAWKRR